MASIRRRNGKYQVQVRVGSYSRSQSFHKLNDAKSWARREEELAQQRRFLGHKYEPKNLAEILNRYSNEITPRKRSCDTERIVLNALLKEDWVNTPLPQLNVTDIAEYRDRRLVAVKPATLRRQLNIVKHACTIAEREWDWLSPLFLLQRVTLPKNIEHVVKRISVADEQALIDAARHCQTQNLSQLLILAIETAMRRGELLALEWQDIDLQRRELLVRRSKNGKSRTIPLTAKAHKTLANIESDCSEPVFPLSANAVRLAFERVRRRAGLTDVRFHDLRHEAISRFFDMNLTFPEVASISGHKTPSQLMHYAHPGELSRLNQFKGNFID
jgi:integrase